MSASTLRADDRTVSPGFAVLILRRAQDEVKVDGGGLHAGLAMRVQAAAVIGSAQAAV